MHFGVATSQKIPLIRLGRINGQKTFDGRIFGGFGGGGLTHEDLKFGRKKHFNLQSVKLTFSFSSIKHVFRHFSRRARCEICSKFTIKTPKHVKLTIKLKIKTSLTSFWPLFC